MIGAMGRKDDPNAVVDSRGRVFGVEALRVVDSSTFPILPPGQTQATVCKSKLSFADSNLVILRSVCLTSKSNRVDMLAEKLADDILMDAGYPVSKGPRRR